MSAYSRKSRDKLATCDVRLQKVFAEVDRLGVTHTILEGQRGEARQNELLRTGKSKVAYPHSEHNATPSRAVDAKPDGVSWADREGFTYFAGIVMGVALKMGVRLRWGGDWDSDGLLSDNAFDDLAHFELNE